VENALSMKREHYVIQPVPPILIDFTRARALTRLRSVLFQFPTWYLSDLADALESVLPRVQRQERSPLTVR